MAKFENLTVSYTDIASTPFQTKQLPKGPTLSEVLARQLTPGQRAALFPKYGNDTYLSASLGNSSLTSSTDVGSGSGGSPNIGPTSGNVRNPVPKATQEIIPAGLIPDPQTGQPVRVPDRKQVPANASVMSKDEIENYIREAAKARGISPDAAIKVFHSEGATGHGPSLQSNIRKSGSGSFNGYEDSHGPFQLYRGGIGADFEQKTGLKIDDPTTFRQQIDFSLDWAAEHGWGKWNGPKNIGMGMNEGLENAQPIGISEYNPEANDTNPEYADIGNVYDLPEDTASPIGVVGDNQQSSSLIPDAAENDGVINPDSKVEQLQGSVASIRKGALDPDLTNLLGMTAQRVSENTGKNISVRVTSGGQRMAGAEGATGTHEHDEGGAADFNFIETLPDGTQRVLDPRVPADKLIINTAVEYFAEAGGRSAGSEYMSDPTKLHFGISRKQPAAYAGTDDFREAFNSGRARYLDWADTNLVDREYGYRETFSREREKRADYYKAQQEEQDRLTAQQKQQETSTQLPPSLPFPVPEIQTPPIEKTAEPVKEATSPKPTLSEMMGTGFTAAAGGSVINDPSLIVSEDGNKVTKVAETGPEKISVLPRHRSSEVSQQPYQKLDESSELPDVIAADKDPTRSIGNSQQSTPLNSNFGIPIDRAFGPQTVGNILTMPRITPSAGKAYADAKMVSRFNKADVDGDMGMVYIDRGYA